MKRYESDGGLGGRGWLSFYEYGEDALYRFTSAILARISERSVQIEEPFYLDKYAVDLPRVRPVAEIMFGITRPLPTRLPISWDRDDEREPE